MRSYLHSSPIRAIVILVLLCMFTVAASAAPDPVAVPDHSVILPGTPDPSDPAEMEVFLDRVMPADLAKYNVPGATVAVVKDSSLVVAKGYGYSDIEKKTPVDANTTLFRIGSISKLFTWTAVMQLVDEGLIDLDAEVNTYLKDVTVPDTYPGHPVTMRHLMTHSAGFEDAERHMAVEDSSDLISIRDYCAGNMPARVRPPGIVSSYSNYGTTLAGVVVEDVTGMPFEQYLDSRILVPLGMNRTSIQNDLPPDLASGLAQGYAYAGMQNDPTPDAVIVTGPAGSISSTAPDMAAFMIAHLQNGTYGNTTLLPASTADLMHTRAFANDPRVPGMCLGFYERDLNGRRMIAHGGDTFTFHSLLVLLPGEQTGFFVSYNSVGGVLARDELFEEFMDHYYPEEPSALPEPGPSINSRIQQYAGTYEGNRHNYAGFEKFLTPGSRMEIAATPNGTLLLQAGQNPVEMAEVRPGVFSSLDGSRPASGDIVFHEAADGTVDYFCHANLPFMVFDRVLWYATAGFLEGVRVAAGILLATVLLWPLLFAFRRAHAVPESPAPVPARVARLIAGGASLTLLSFVFVLVPWIAGDGALVHSYMYDTVAPPLLAAVLTVPVIAAALTLATVGLAALAWKKGYWTTLDRVHYTIVAVALVALLWWVNFWNLWVFCL